MTQLSSIVQFLDSYLETSEFTDASLNGLQVESSNEAVRRVAVAVDSGLSIIQQACEHDSDLLVVHHGLFWGQAVPVTGAIGKKVELLLRHRCSLYASHLPLDGHREAGNGAGLARFFDLDDIEPFCEYKGRAIGARGALAKPQPIEYFVEKVAELPGSITPLVLQFGSQEIRSVGLVTGSGSMALEQCAEAGIDLLISGEAKQEAYHLAKELEVNVLFAGHYATETFGVRALQEKLEKDFDVETIFIDEPTGI